MVCKGVCLLNPLQHNTLMLVDNYPSSRSEIRCRETAQEIRDRTRTRICYCDSWCNTLSNKPRCSSSLLFLFYFSNGKMAMENVFCQAMGIWRPNTQFHKHLLVQLHCTSWGLHSKSSELTRALYLPASLVAIH